jgi:glycosyltransferase involved in cell wall biosynthesis
MKKIRPTSGSYTKMKSIQSYNNENTIVCLIVPTYNEVKNIPTLVNAVFSDFNMQRYDEEKISLHMLVVDDSSPDGTADIVRSMQAENPNIHLYVRKEKNGLGAAYVAGMKYAMTSLDIDPEIVFEMDADMSHDPSYIVPMINKVRQGADFVIGTRYVDGGSIPDNWGFKRKAISKGANLYAKLVLRIPNVSDYTSGYRAIRTEALRQIDFNTINTKGYGFQISLLEAMRRNGAIMDEVPIHFVDRTEGESKMRINDIVEEGMFVLRTGFENMFAGRRVPASISRSRAERIEKEEAVLKTAESITPVMASENFVGSSYESQGYDAQGDATSQGRDRGIA